MTSQPPDQRIPTNLITGFLGAGKTSALLSLMPFRPAHERWAILVNEYGMVSLDHILLDESGDGPASGVDVDELAGGCFCCSLSMVLPLALARLIRRTKPHRIFLEPTGSGHPAAVIDLLRKGRFAEQLDLQSIICLVDPRDYLNPRITNSAVFQDQIQMADVVAINFVDRCDRQQVDLCKEFVLSQDPPKLHVAETTFGKLQPEWLTLNGIVTRPPGFSDVHAPHSQHSHVQNPADLQTVNLGEETEPVTIQSSVPLPGRPLRLENEGLGQYACGWIFNPSDVFARDRLLDLLGNLRPILRLKGVFHCSDDWWSIQRRGQDTRLQRSAYRRDSRLEIIVDQRSTSWDEIQSKLLECLGETMQG